jgi:predicted nucleic acid-binding Zn ribbon protein
MLRPAWTGLDEAIEELGMRRQLARHQLQACWPELAGSRLAAHSQPHRLRGPVLWVLTRSSNWTQELVLEQRGILDRIRQRFAHLGLEQIRCRVGTLRPLLETPAPAPFPDLRQLVLPTSVVSRLEAVAAEIHDPELRASVLKALLQQERRNQWLRSQGAMACSHCGRLQSQKFCLGCRQERRRRRRQKLFRWLGRQPWLTLPEAQSRVPNLRGSEFHTARHQLLSNLRLQFWQLREGLPEGQPLASGLRQILVEICMLATSTPWDQLQEKHLRYALGKTWARAYLEDRTPTPWGATTSSASPRPGRRASRWGKTPGGPEGRMEPS